MFIFIPGFAGGDGDYIKKVIPSELKKRGIEFICLNVQGFDSITKHAERMVALVNKMNLANLREPAHFIGHSMGGLVLRYAVNHLKDFAPTVKSITTCATPHLGTPFADQAVGKYHPAVSEMSLAGVSKWNDPSSAYYSPQPKDIPCFGVTTKIPSPFKAEKLIEGYMSYRLSGTLRKLGLPSENDGVVPLFSQEFGTPYAELDVAHAWFSSLYKKGPSIIDFYEQLHFHLEDKAVSVVGALCI